MARLWWVELALEQREEQVGTAAQAGTVEEGGIAEEVQPVGSVEPAAR